MTDIFDNIILCNKCGKKMQLTKIPENGFLLRAMVLIPASVMYICIFLAVFGLVMLLKESANYEQ